MKRTSKAYIGTYHVDSASDMIHLDELKRAFKAAKSPLMRMCIKPRLGKNNPNRHNYPKFGQHLTIHMAHAQRYDVYIYRKSRPFVAPWRD